MTEAALISHLVAQTQANISFLQTHAYLSPSDASDILSKLETANTKNPDNSMLTLTRNLNISPSPPQPTPQIFPTPSQQYHSPPQSPYAQSVPPSQPWIPPPQSSFPPPPVQPENQRARALWAYNEDGREPNDLSFSVGEVIEITEETNADWWKGRVRGREGLFPSNYVERLPPQAGPNNKEYKPFNSGAMTLPPAFGTTVVGPPQAGGQEKKKGGFGGKYGNTIAQSAAGGLGFGAGAAVGSGIINSIF